MKKLKFTLFLIVPLFLLNCEKEPIDTPSAEILVTNSIKVENYSFDQLEKDSNFTSVYNEFKEELELITKAPSSSKSIIKSFDFTIDKRAVNKVKREEITSYTFRVIRNKPQEGTFDNIVIQKNTKGKMEAFLISYHQNSGVKRKELNSGFDFQGKVTIKKINYSSLFSKAVDDQIIISTTVCTADLNGTCGNAPHIPGDRCYSKSSCIEIRTSFNGGGSSNGYNPYSSTYHNAEDSNGSSNTKGVTTSPVIDPCDDAIHGCDKMPWKKLTDRLNITNANQIKYLKDNPSVVGQINDFLNNNNNAKGKAFAEKAVAVLTTAKTTKEKNIVNALLKGKLDLAMDLLLKEAHTPQYRCPNPPCPEDIAEAIIQDVVIQINKAFDGQMNLLLMAFDQVTYDPYTRVIKTGLHVKKLLIKAGADVSNDISLLTLGQVFKVRVRGRNFIVEPANQNLWDTMKDVGMSTFDVAVLISPIKGGGAYGLLVKTGGRRITAAALSKFIKNYGAIATTTLKGGRGYKSFYLFKKAIGKLKAKTGHALHHIVEQRGFKGLNTLKFGNKNIHNTKNIIEIPTGNGTLHNAVTKHYMSKFRFTNGKTVREWISTKNFQEQYDYGIKILKQNGWDGKYGIIQ